MECWWRTNTEAVPCLQSPMLSDDFRQVLEYRSGRNPLLLRGIVEALADFTIEEIQVQSDLVTTIWVRILKNAIWGLVEDQVGKFIFDAMIRGGVWEER